MEILPAIMENMVRSLKNRVVVLSIAITFMSTASPTAKYFPSVKDESFLLGSGLSVNFANHQAKITVKNYWGFNITFIFAFPGVNTIGILSVLIDIDRH